MERAVGEQGEQSSKRIEGSVFGAYRVGPRIESDSFASVHAAVEQGSGRAVSLRILHRALRKDDAIARAIVTGVEVAKAAGGPHVVRGLAHGVTDGLPWGAYEATPARSLRTLLILRGRLPLATALEVAQDALLGLEAIHAAGWVHGDVKPESLRPLDAAGERTRWRLVSLELARWAPALREEEPATLLDPLEPRGRGYSGTPEYSAPEQCAGEPLDARADLYALGVTLFEMLTGSLPIAAESPLAFLAHHMVAEPRTLAGAAPDLAFPRALQEVLDRALAKRRPDRFASAAEMAEALSGLRPHAPGPRGEERRPPTPPRGLRSEARGQP